MDAAPARGIREEDTMPTDPIIIIFGHLFFWF
jgi:hypothetical protein